jgi:hypothetical protein
MGPVVPVWPMCYLLQYFCFIFPRWGSTYLMVESLLKIKDATIELSDVGNRRVQQYVKQCFVQGIFTNPTI